MFEATNELVKFKLIQMPCCGFLACWVNPRLPSYCPECGKHILAQLRTERPFLIEADAWLRLEADKPPPQF